MVLLLCDWELSWKGLNTWGPTQIAGRWNHLMVPSLTYVKPRLFGTVSWGATQSLLMCLFFFFKIFWMGTIFKVFIEFVTVLLLFYVLVFWPRGMWDLSSLIRDRTHTPCIGRRSPNHWTTRKVSSLCGLSFHTAWQPQDIQSSYVVGQDSKSEYF